MKTKAVIMSQKAAHAVGWSSEAIQIFLGSLYIALLAQIEIPLMPIPVTLHTFAIFTLALFQGGRRSLFSLLLYLFEATIGLPVFPGAYIDPFWMFSLSAGYCFSFPLAAYIVGKSTEVEGSHSTAWMIFGLCSAQLIIYLMGATWMSFTLGWKQALAVGVYPFVLIDLVKLLTAFSIKMGFKQLAYLYTDR